VPVFINFPSKLVSDRSLIGSGIASVLEVFEIVFERKKAED
jgi:hypothetical protein